MKKRGMIGAVVAATIILSACGQGLTGGSDVGAVYAAEMTRVADALDSVKDEASARKASVEIAQAAASLQKLQGEFDGQMSGLKAMQVLQKHGKEITVAQTRIMGSMLRLQSEYPELMDIVSSDLDDLDI